MDPVELEEAVRRVDFTPTHVRLWIEGTLLVESSPDSTAPTVWLVAEASGQRFELREKADADAVLAALRDRTGARSRVWGLAVRSEGKPEVILHVEGYDD